MTITNEITLTDSPVLTVNEILAALEWAELGERLVGTRSNILLAREASLVLTGAGRDFLGFQAKGMAVAIELFETCAEADFMDFAFKLAREIEHADYVPAKVAGLLRAKAMLQKV